MTPDIRMLLDSLDERPWFTLIALADAHEEIGDTVRAEGLRWLVRWRRWPRLSMDGTYNWVFFPYTLENISLRMDHYVFGSGSLESERAMTKKREHIHWTLAESFLWVSKVIGELLRDTPDFPTHPSS